MARRHRAGRFQRQPDVGEAEAATVETVALAVDHRARLYLPRMFGASRFAILPSPAHLADAMARVCLTLLR